MMSNTKRNSVSIFHIQFGYTTDWIHITVHTSDGYDRGQGMNRPLGDFRPVKFVLYINICYANYESKKA